MDGEGLNPDKMSYIFQLHGGAFGLLISCSEAEMLPFKDNVPIANFELVYTKLIVGHKMGAL